MSWEITVLLSLAVRQIVKERRRAQAEGRTPDLRSRSGREAEPVAGEGRPEHDAPPRTPEQR